MDEDRIGRTWMVLVGIALIGAGLLGFVPDNPIASDNEQALFHVNATHNVIHLLTGAIALGIGLGMRGLNLATAMIGFGVLYGLVLLVGVFDPTLFGLFADVPLNAADHVLHAALAIGSIALGVMRRNTADTAVTPR